MNKQHLITAAVIIGLITLSIFAGNFISDEFEKIPVEEWSLQEAIFYGFCVLSFATYISRHT